jgi:hypothetical protein
MRDAAKKLGLSDNGLRKHCMKAFVPLPPQGHWNKVHAGQKVRTTPLVPRPPGVSDTVTVGAWDYREHNKRLMETEPVCVCGMHLQPPALPMLIGRAFLPAGRAADMPDPYPATLAAGGSADFVAGGRPSEPTVSKTAIDVM